MIFLTCLVVFLEISERKNSILKSWLYENNTTHEFVVATVAMTPDKNPAISLEKMAGFINHIKKAHPNVDLIFFGEAILGWFKSGDEKYHKEIAMPIPSATTDFIAKLAKDNNVYISFGMAYKQDDKVYNSQVLISDNGEIIKIQSKKNVRSEGFNPGQESVAFIDIKGIKFGIVICFDIRSKETLRKVKDNNIDLIFLSNADYIDEWDNNYFGYKHMAKRYNTWIITSNRYGMEDKVRWDGHIEILNPFGDVLASGTMKEQFIVYNIKINKDQSGIKNFIRKAYSKMSIVYLILKNPKTAVSYI